MKKAEPQGKKITLEELTTAINEFFKGRDNDPNVRPDLVITETESIFKVQINSPNSIMHTGLGGLKTFMKFTDLTSMKIEYNGTILNQEQKEELKCKLEK